MHAQVHRTTRQILAIGHFPTPPSDPLIAVVEVRDSERPTFDLPGDKLLEEDGTVSVLPLTEEQAAHLAWREAQAEARDADLATIRQAAADDPRFAALARHLGIAP